MTFRLPYVTPTKPPQSWSTPDATQQSNLELFQNPIPFAQFEWPRVHPVILYVPDVQHTAINNYPNPIPINNAVLLIPSVRVRLATQPAATQVNILIPIPFNQLDWRPVQQVPSVKSRDYLQNIGLYTNPIPNKQTDWSNPFRTPDPLPSGSYPANINLLVAVVGSPFYTQDFSTTKIIPDYLPFIQQPLNINLFKNPIPFSTQDFARNSINPDWATVPLYPNIVLPIVFPFYTQDWSKTQFLPSVPSPSMALNINTFTNPVPLNQLNWSKLWVLKPSISDPSVYNLVLLAPTGPAPFSQSDWSKTGIFRTIASDQNTLPNFPLTHPSLPSNPLGIFYFQDWSSSRPSPLIVSDQTNLPNITLPNTPIVVITEFHQLPFLVTMGPMSYR